DEPPRPEPPPPRLRPPEAGPSDPERLGPDGGSSAGDRGRAYHLDPERGHPTVARLARPPLPGRPRPRARDHTRLHEPGRAVRGTRLADGPPDWRAPRRVAVPAAVVPCGRFSRQRREPFVLL